MNLGRALKANHADPSVQELESCALFWKIYSKVYSKMREDLGANQGLSCTVTIQWRIPTDDSRSYETVACYNLNFLPLTLNLNLLSPEEGQSWALLFFSLPPLTPILNTAVKA